MSEPTNPALIPFKEFCERNRVGRDYCYKLIRTGAIEAVKVGPFTHITAESEQRWRDNLPRLQLA